MVNKVEKWRTNWWALFGLINLGQHLTFSDGLGHILLPYVNFCLRQTPIFESPVKYNLLDKIIRSCNYDSFSPFPSSPSPFQNNNDSWEFWLLHIIVFQLFNAAFCLFGFQLIDIIVGLYFLILSAVEPLMQVERHTKEVYD